MHHIKHIFKFIPWSFLLVIFGILYYQADLLVWALLIGYIAANFISVIHHLYWAHQYVIPKNKFIKILIDLIGYISWPSIFLHPKAFWTYSHWYHHKHWGTNDDFVQIDNNNITMFTQYVIFRPFSLFFKIRNSTNGMKKLKIYMETMSQADQHKVTPFIDQYYRIITITIHISLMLLLGMKYYFYFVFFTCWMYSMHLALFGEYVPHVKRANDESEKDHPWAFLLAPEYSYHYSHHKYGALILGPGKWRYLNLQYYFIKLFYNIQTKTII